MRYDAGARAASLQVLQGTASSTPTTPAISRTELIYDLCLAEITRPAGSTAVTTGQITDTRLDEKLCGIVRDGVTGIPTDELLVATKERIGELEETAATSAAASRTARKQPKSSETEARRQREERQDQRDRRPAGSAGHETEHTAALQDIARARTTALTDVANSTQDSHHRGGKCHPSRPPRVPGSASTASTKALGEASASAGAAKNDADRAEKASTDAGQCGHQCREAGQRSRNL